jgi:hypothetical protein
MTVVPARMPVAPPSTGDRLPGGPPCQRSSPVTAGDARRFTGRQRAALYLAGGGVCTRCGAQLAPGWHGDHQLAFTAGGATDVVNGLALCPGCNTALGAHA